MFSSSSLSLIFVAGALAQTQDLFVPSFPVVAYPVASIPNGATTYMVGCTAGSDPKTCSFSQPYTLVEGPNTAVFTMSVPGQGVATVACALEGKTSMECSATGDAGSPGSTVTATTTVSGVAAETHFRAVSIVSDAAAIMTFPAPTTTSAPPTTSHTSTSHTTQNSTTVISKTAITNSTTTFPTTTSTPLVGTAPANTTAPVSSSPATTSSPPTNDSAHSASIHLGGVLGAAVAIVAAFMAGVL